MTGSQGAMRAWRQHRHSLSHQVLQPVAEEPWPRHEGDDVPSDTTVNSAIGTGVSHGPGGNLLPLRMPGIKCEALPWPSEIRVAESSCSITQDEAGSVLSSFDEQAESCIVQSQIRHSCHHAMPDAQVFHSMAGVGAPHIPGGDGATTNALATEPLSPNETTFNVELHDALSIKTPSTLGTQMSNLHGPGSQRWGGALAAVMSSAITQSALSLSSAQSILHAGATGCVNLIFYAQMTCMHSEVGRFAVQTAVSGCFMVDVCVTGHRVHIV